LNKSRNLLATAAVLLAAACATIVPDLPPITESPTGLSHSGKVVWHDLLTTTPGESRRFYGELFGWTFESPGIDFGVGADDAYMLIRHDGQVIGGMLDANVLKKDVNVSQWLMMVSVTDIHTASAQAAAEGGTVLTPPTELASRGWLAVIEDPRGALFVLIQAKGGDPADREPAMNQFLWDELWTDDVSEATSFYSKIIGYEPDDRALGETGRDYRVMTTSGRPRAGIMQNPFEDVRPVWVNYLRVEDPALIASRVEALGGQVLVEAQKRDVGGTAAFIAGPSGAGIALQTWPLD